MPKQNLPASIVMSDRDGKVYYDCVLLRVESRDEEGRIESLTFIPPDRMVELSEDASKNEFIFAYVRRDLIKQ